MGVLENVVPGSQIVVNLAQIVMFYITILQISAAKKSFDKEMNVKFYLEYTKHFDNIMKEWPQDTRNQSLAQDYGILPPDERGRFHAVMIHYLNLCSE